MTPPLEYCLKHVLILYVGRRTAGGATTGSTGYGSPAPSTGHIVTGTQRSARLAAPDYNQSARQSPMPRRPSPSVEAEEDAEGEEDDGNEEDKNLYCFCQKLSYGTVRTESPGVGARCLQLAALRWLAATTKTADTNGYYPSCAYVLPQSRLPYSLVPRWVRWAQRPPGGRLVLPRVHYATWPEARCRGIEERKEKEPWSLMSHIIGLF